MPRKKKSGRVRTNMAVVPMSDAEQRDALARIAFGDSWREFEEEIAERLRDYDEDTPIRQSTRRALAMIKDMAFDHL